MSIFNSGLPANSAGAARAFSMNLNIACIANAGSLKNPGRYVMGRHEISGTTKVDAFGSACVTARDHSKVYAWEAAMITANDNAIVIGAGQAQIIALNYSNIIASDNVTVHARDNAAVEALGKATVYASGNAHIRSLESSTIHASGNCTVEALSLTGCTIYLSENAQIVGHSGKARIVKN
jgi:hypothetical protein